MAAKVEQCENCGGQIGELEIPRVFKDHTVCAACHKRLRLQDGEEDVKKVEIVNAVKIEFKESVWTGIGLGMGFILSLPVLLIFIALCIGIYYLIRYIAT